MNKKGSYFSYLFGVLYQVIFLIISYNITLLFFPGVFSLLIIPESIYPNSYTFIHVDIKQTWKSRLKITINWKLKNKEEEKQFLKNTGKNLPLVSALILSFSCCLTYIYDFLLIIFALQTVDSFNENKDESRSRFNSFSFYFLSLSLGCL